MSKFICPVDYRSIEKPDESLQIGGATEHWVGDQNIRMAPGTELWGSPVDGNRARLINHGYRQSALGCAWQLNDQVRIHDIDLECRHQDRGQQSQVVGFQGAMWPKDTPKPYPYECVSDATAWLEHVGIYGRTFGLYMWGGYHNVVHAYRCRIEAGQFPVLAGGGSGDDAQFLHLHDCDLIVDFDKLIGAGGDQGLNACGLCAQGGRVFMYGGSIRVKGGKESERAVGAWTTKFAATPPAPKPQWPYPWPFMELHNVDCKVAGKGCTGPVFDALADVGTLRIFGGSGSGPGGKWLAKSGVQGKAYVDGVLAT